MSKLQAAYWEDYYASTDRFGQLFRDYSDLKHSTRTVEQNVQYRVVQELIDGKLSL